MASRLLTRSPLVGFGLAALLVAAGLLIVGPAARALPPAGTEIMSVTGEVSVASRLGSETIALEGTVEIQRDSPRTENGVEVVDAEITSMRLQGQSLTGSIVITESPTRASTGEIRSLQSSSQFPASSFFDVFFEAQVPASPPSTNPLTLHNEVALHVAPAGDLSAWPPVGVTYQAQPEAPAGSHCTPPAGPGGLPLLPSLPAEICVTSASVTLEEPRTPTPTITPCPPAVCTPTPTGSPTPTWTPGPTPPPAAGPTYSVAPEGPSGFHPADLLGLGAAPVAVSGNDSFAQAWPIASLPFIGQANTAGTSIESGEPAPCGLINSTIWFHFTPLLSDTVVADTIGSSYDTVLAVYTGDSLATLSQVACDDDSGVGDAFGPSRLTFAATAGTRYYFQAGGFFGATGDLTLNVSFTGAPPQGVTGVRIPCTNLGLTADGCDDGFDGDQDDVDALSFGADFTQGENIIDFSVAPASAGLPETAVASQAACTPAQPQADQFAAPLDGSNGLVLDGDGVNGFCPTTAAGLGLIERPGSDDLNALASQGSSVVDADGDGSPEEPVFFSLAEGSPSLGLLRSAADVLWTVGGFQPGVYASAAALGLQPGDDIDGLCLADQGAGSPIFDPEVDTLLFSLTPGSPTLDDLGAGAADLLAPGPRVRVAAADLGLQDGDNLDALACLSEPPEPTPTPTPTLPGLLGDANLDAGVNSTDALLVLQLDAALVTSLTCQPCADANRDGRADSLDAALILQYDAGFIDGLPPTPRPTPTATPAPIEPAATPPPSAFSYGRPRSM